MLKTNKCLNCITNININNRIRRIKRMNIWKKGSIFSACMSNIRGATNNLHSYCQRKKFGIHKFCLLRSWCDVSNNELSLLLWIMPNQRHQCLQSLIFISSVYFSTRLCVEYHFIFLSHTKHSVLLLFLALVNQHLRVYDELRN